MENILTNNKLLKRNSKFPQLTTDQLNNVSPKQDRTPKLKPNVINEVAAEFGSA